RRTLRCSRWSGGRSRLGTHRRPKRQLAHEGRGDDRADAGDDADEERLTDREAERLEERVVQLGDERCEDRTHLVGRRAGLGRRELRDRLAEALTDAGELAQVEPATAVRGHLPELIELTLEGRRHRGLDLLEDRADLRWDLLAQRRGELRPGDGQPDRAADLTEE